MSLLPWYCMTRCIICRIVSPKLNLCTAIDVGTTLRVTDVALPYTVQLEAHEGTRWQDGPLGWCNGRFLEVQDTEGAEQGKFRDRSTVNLVVLD
jgi:hypothetical protein